MNPATGALYGMMDTLAEGGPELQYKRLDDGPPEPAPKPAGLAPVRIASAVHRSGVHVVDEDTPDATLCGAEVSWLFRDMPDRKVARPCRKCQGKLRELVDAGEWTGPAGG